MTGDALRRTRYQSTVLLLTLLTLACTLTPPRAQAQEFSLGADFVSRYVWRGFDFGDSFSVQPAASFGIGGLEIGTWASYSISEPGAGSNEHDLYVSLTTPVGAGSFSVGVTDYYFPNTENPDFFDFDDEGAGAHYLEPFAAYVGPESFPITLFAGFMAYNDPDNPFYLEIGYAFSVDGVDVGLAAGGITSESGFYGTTDAAVTNLALSVGKAIPVTNQFALPVAVSYVLNPYNERTFLVFGVSL